jgi:hypothetical protein
LTDLPPRVTFHAYIRKDGPVQVVDILSEIWWAFALACGALSWYVHSTARARAKRLADEREALRISHDPKDGPVPDVQKYRSWDLHVYTWLGLFFAFLAFTGMVFWAIGLIISSFLPFGQ